MEVRKHWFIFSEGLGGHFQENITIFIFSTRKLTLIIRGTFNQELVSCHILVDFKDNLSKSITCDNYMSWDFSKLKSQYQQNKTFILSCFLLCWLGIPLPSLDHCDILRRIRWIYFIFTRLKQLIIYIPVLCALWSVMGYYSPKVLIVRRRNVFEGNFHVISFIREILGLHITY